MVREGGFRQEKTDQPEKGKPPERVGRKATGLRLAGAR
jgi:hypothetical protein